MTTLGQEAVASAARFKPLSSAERRELRVVIAERIMQEGGFTRTEAHLGIQLAEELVAKARRRGYEPVHLLRGQLHGRGYRVLDAICGHNAFANPGSLHAALEFLLLDRSKGELSFKHYVTNLAAGRRHCTVLVEVSMFDPGAPSA